MPAESNVRYRTEHDLLGEKAVPENAYYGIHALRAAENFNISGRTVHPQLIQAIVLVKKAAAMTHKKLNTYTVELADAIIGACDDIAAGQLADQFIVDAFQGGAGTSTNMNVNEVIANRAIERLGGKLGDYSIVHPLDHVNHSQSTNDVYPTALKIAAIRLLRPLANAFASLQEAFQRKEAEFAGVMKLGRTQLMDAVPLTAGQEFGAYAKALARDRWRLYKVEERLREVNIGGTAIGTGLNAPLKYTFLITDYLQQLTGLGIARSEYAIDQTQNMDVFVEVSGLLKAAAVNLIKISGDLRLLASGPAGGLGELRLPAVQAGSSIMPGKVNPVVAEMIGLVAMRVIANDTAITQAALGGQLELNAFTPLIAESLLESLELLTRGIATFERMCVDGIEVDAARCEQLVQRSSALATTLVDYLGYERASDIARQAQAEKTTIREVVLRERIMSEEQIDRIINPNQVTRPGIPGK